MPWTWYMLNKHLLIGLNWIELVILFIYLVLYEFSEFYRASKVFHLYIICFLSVLNIQA